MHGRRMGGRWIVLPEVQVGKICGVAASQGGAVKKGIITKLAVFVILYNRAAKLFFNRLLFLVGQTL
jgi:hypothetical protein